MQEQINMIAKHQERLKDVIEHLEVEKYNIQSYKENYRLYEQEIRQLERKIDKLENRINKVIEYINEELTKDLLTILQGKEDD